jgi:hypothetical protein
LLPGFFFKNARLMNKKEILSRFVELYQLKDIYRARARSELENLKKTDRKIRELKALINPEKN